MMNVKEHDFRANSLDKTISALYTTILEMEEFRKENYWYDGLFFLEDTEHIFGLAFIAFQNYINASIKDLTNIGGKDLQTKYYKLGNKLKPSNYTLIELIVALANYIKHKEDDAEDFHRSTRNVLTNFKLNTNKDCDITESAIFKGLDKIDQDWNLKNIQSRVEEWRRDIALCIIANTQNAKPFTDDLLF
ncbi:hypothetical protein [uncultured Flavobacterium sp.]|uniref:hypothetical protein n=1 Tax=uncultured Flavobacterium sp. TaxID=165435 RepID=UPI001214500B|nr:hypothetical protein [uncultured Flavobacterium sp.]THD31918.1 MAG: hypothetical protein DI588_09980 [Flavobacterium johnsoniae]